MVLPRSKKPGDPLTATDHNAIRDSANRGAKPSTGVGLDGLITPIGVTLAPTPIPEQIEDAIHAELTSDTAGVIFGVVEIYEHYTGILAKCRQPTQSGFGWLGVLLSESGEGDAPWVQYRGIGKLAYEGDIEIGQRLGGKKDSHVAQADQGGPFLVKEIETEPDGDDAGTAIVEITQRRLDAKMVDCDTLDTDASGPFHTIIYSGFGVTLDSPGVITTA